MIFLRLNPISKFSSEYRIQLVHALVHLRELGERAGIIDLHGKVNIRGVHLYFKLSGLPTSIFRGFLATIGVQVSKCH